MLKFRYQKPNVQYYTYSLVKYAKDFENRCATSVLVFEKKYRISCRVH